MVSLSAKNEQAMPESKVSSSATNQGLDQGQGEAAGTRVEFTGTGREFFGIWIVNILLSVITLGVYSAWAAVRTRKYMAGHTIVDGYAMEYHAKGIQLLIGRLLAITVLVALTVTSQFFLTIPWMTWVYVALVIVIFFAFPWILNRSFTFHNRMTSWRNVRFNWTAGYGQSFMVLYIWPLLYIVPFMNPFVWRAQQEFLANHSGFGGRKFSLSTDIGPYYIIFLFVMVMGAGATILFAFPLIGGIAAAVIFVDEGTFPDWIAALIFPAYLAILAIFAVIGAFFFNRVRNLSINNLALDGLASFTSDAKARRYIWILISSGFLMIITLGLYTPWAIIRVERHLRTSVSVNIHGDVDSIVDHVAEAGGAFGAEYAGFEGIDVGI